MSSMILQQSQAGTGPQNSLLSFMATRTTQGNGEPDPFSRTLSNRLEGPRERTPERQTEPTRETQPARPDEAPRKAEHTRGGERRTTASNTDRSADGTAAAQDAAGTDTAVPPPATTSQQSGEAPAEDAQTGADDPANPADAVAALPAALAALLGKTSMDTPEDVSGAEEPALGDVLTGKGGRKNAASGDDIKGKWLQNLRGDKTAPGADATANVNAGGNAAKIASLVAQLQPKTEASVGTLTAESGTKAIGGDTSTALHGLLSPRTSNPLQPGPQLQVATPLGQRGWAEEVGNKLIWLTNRGESKAELVITPPNLGKVEVSINMNGDQATAHFVAATREAKEALEEALPRLRELMQQSGVNLGQTSVSTSGGQHAHAGSDNPSGQGHGRGNGSGNGEQADGGGGAAEQGGWTKQGEGLVDIFA
ncbi:hypothetical protein E6C76_09145 [Pseudothauera nasutitermitis]|uniref:Flagellar hook-length control protein-like C-terminal domain-containing protein n=1 Tax=Pseudothauera nasutitermitis TaxID=2565930 RepID=A0A4S4B0Y3_9RHOO|nr:flagellar hook-length control protein FliK [Pseudothauera nasutitermitis]THF65712.1 hypothetical protein E6C76_09145 [Pseudothauera nasutitermitis]